MGSYEDIFIHDKGRVRCGLCAVLISHNDYNINQHLRGNRHGDAYTRRLALRNNITFLDEGFDCRVCDESFFDLEDHVNSYDHQTIMQDIYELIDGEFINLPNVLNHIPGIARCLICNCKIGFRYYDLQVHINGNRHSENHSNTLKSQNGIFNVDGDDDQLWCKICSDYFDYYCFEDLKGHIDDTNHYEALAAIENLIEDENIDIHDYLTSLNQDKAFCNECDVPVPCNENNLYEHINGSRHSS